MPRPTPSFAQLPHLLRRYLHDLFHTSAHEMRRLTLSEISRLTSERHFYNGGDCANPVDAHAHHDALGTLAHLFVHYGTKLEELERRLNHLESRLNERDEVQDT